jgi:hypothetical protein
MAERNCVTNMSLRSKFRLQKRVAEDALVGDDKAANTQHTVLATKTPRGRAVRHKGLKGFKSASANRSRRKRVIANERVLGDWEHQGSTESTRRGDGNGERRLSQNVEVCRNENCVDMS